MTDLSAQSASHWSEERRAGMEAFYRLATDDYRHLALSKDWSALLTTAQNKAGDRPLRLLDVACGSGKFPNALAQYAGLSTSHIQPIETALLDASAFSIAEARAALPSLFKPTAEYETMLQDFVVPEQAFDIVWATHALYAIPEFDLAEALRRFCAAIAPGGVGLIAHSAAAGHYISFHRHFLDATGQTDRPTFISAEIIVALLRADGADVSVQEISYQSVAGPEDNAAVEGFLQRCAFDERLSLAEMKDAPLLAEYLAGCSSEAGWAFDQRVWLMTITG